MEGSNELGVNGHSPFVTVHYPKRSSTAMTPYIHSISHRSAPEPSKNNASRGWGIPHCNLEDNSKHV